MPFHKFLFLISNGRVLQLRIKDSKYFYICSPIYLAIPRIVVFYFAGAYKIVDKFACIIRGQNLRVRCRVKTISRHFAGLKFQPGHVLGRRKHLGRSRERYASRSMRTKSKEPRSRERRAGLTLDARDFTCRWLHPNIQEAYTWEPRMPHVASG